MIISDRRREFILPLSYLIRVATETLFDNFLKMPYRNFL